MLILHVTLCMGETFLASLADYCGQNTEVSDGLKSRVTLPFRLDIELEILSLALSVVKRRKSPPSTQSITLPPLSCHIVPSLQLSKVVRKKGGRVLRQEKVALRDKLFICEQAGRLPASLPLMTLLPPSSVQRFPSSPFLPPSSPHFSKRWSFFPPNPSQLLRMFCCYQSKLHTGSSEKFLLRSVTHVLFGGLVGCALAT